MRGLIVVDVQNDFCEGGALAVEGGAAVASAISDHLRAADYDHVVATRDHHIDPGTHFSAAPDFVSSWPPHCRRGTAGASFHPALDVGPVEAVFSKGEYDDGYSGFGGAEPGGAGLADWLRDHGVDAVDVVGIATDHCVRATALDAVAAGFTTTVLLDLCAAVAPDSSERAQEQMQEAGVVLTASAPGALE